MFGILKQDSGDITLLGERIDPIGINPIFARIGNIIEIPVFYKNLTAKENLDIHCEYLGTSQLKKDISDILLLVGLNNVTKKKVGEFSLGMKQRLALGRALIGNPQLLILDEPINGLDPMGIGAIRDILLTINREKGTTMLISSHIISEIEKIAHTVGIIDNGLMLSEEPLAHIKNKSTDLETYFKEIVTGGYRDV